MNYSYVTALNTIDYLPGVLALKKSLNSIKSKYPLTVLTTPQLLNDIENALNENGIKFITKPDLVCETGSSKFSHWGNTFFKLRVSELNGFEKILLLDSDMLIVKNIDHLFLHSHSSAVVAGQLYKGNENWKELNSGLMVLEPAKIDSEKLYNLIQKTIDDRRKIGLPTGDQDVFQTYFKDWCLDKHLHLDQGYNLFFSTISYYITMNFIKESDIYVVHFVGKYKPWMHTPLKEKIKLHIFNLFINRKGSKYLRHYNEYF
ncbi:hypothetical protein PS862_01357 [Pseudomonas fluorescens]|uniref:Glycosyl transferase n=1 Tax=Pseudomonas fluorescens TaxID=294 RepID=A0A5E7I3X4_PSEFL|nr:glycosyltransferase [Pseudomonas fluorescens]VVO71419.1 hypothetical protein PS862_01357 [Pseudomonas fluorescens]